MGNPGCETLIRRANSTPVIPGITTFVATAILWPASSDALINASGIAAAAFGFPAGIVLVFAYLLNHEHREEDEG